MSNFNFNVLLLNGHGDGDVGAQGNGYREADLTRECTDRVEAGLKKYCNVYRYPKERNAFKDIQNGVFKSILNKCFPGVKFHYAFERHFNAFNISAYGTEMFVVPEENGISVEQAIMKRMGKYFKLRDNDNIFDGVKRTRFLVINTLKQMGISGALLETCFIDNPNDMKIWKENKAAIDNDIVAGIVEGFGLGTASEGTTQKPSKPVTPPSQSGSGFKINDKVKLSANATKYQGASLGVPIPASVKGKTYTVQQISSDGKCLLLKEIYSWVLTSECSKGTSGGSTTNTKTLKVGMKATPKTAVSYDGVKLISSVTKRAYTVIEVRGNRVVLGDGLNTAFNITNLSY